MGVIGFLVWCGLIVEVDDTNEVLVAKGEAKGGRAGVCLWVEHGGVAFKAGGVVVHGKQGVSGAL